MKKTYFIIVVLVILVSIFGYAETSFNFLTKGYADTLYCPIGGDCTLSNLNVTGTLTTENTNEINLTGNITTTKCLVLPGGYFVCGSDNNFGNITSSGDITTTGTGTFGLVNSTIYGVGNTVIKKSGNGVVLDIESPVGAIPGLGDNPYINFTYITFGALNAQIPIIDMNRGDVFYAFGGISTPLYVIDRLRSSDSEIYLTDKLYMKQTGADNRFGKISYISNTDTLALTTSTGANITLSSQSGSGNINIDGTLMMNTNNIVSTTGRGKFGGGITLPVVSIDWGEDPPTTDGGIYEAYGDASGYDDGWTGYVYDETQIAIYQVVSYGDTWYVSGRMDQAPLSVI